MNPAAQELHYILLNYGHKNCIMYALSFLSLVDAGVLALALGLERVGRVGVVMPVALPLVDEPVVDLLQLQPCFLHQFCLVVLLPIYKIN